MSETNKQTNYTVGHSTKTIEEFLQSSFSFEIKILADIRRLSDLENTRWREFTSRNHYSSPFSIKLITNV
ncbi:hypothetical protein [Kaistella polysaccharea]|uniref:hypothetical protein n=1 Tax=Kaistella polysaccharea TaxID=2878534 RepID=UPI001CF3139F|nr:hypothetical protein [Kaistella polysaccharea]